MISFSRNRPLFFWMAILVVLTSIGLEQLPDPQSRRLFADQATHIMAAQSIWYDLDLQYTVEDLARFRKIMPKEPGPAGAILKVDNYGNFYFAKPFLYALFSSPFVSLWGLNGFIIFNALCLGVIGLIAMKVFIDIFNEWISLFLSIGLLVFSPFFAWIPVAHPDIFICFLLTTGGFLLISTNITINAHLLGAVILGLSLYEKPTFIFIVPFLVLTLVGRFNNRFIFKLIFFIFLGWSIPSIINLVQDGNILSYQGSRFYVRSSPGSFPLDPGWSMSNLRPTPTGRIFKVHALVETILSNLPLFPSKLLDTIIGRQTGIFLYFPVALFLLIYLVLRPTWRSLVMIGAFLLYLSIHWLVFPTNGYGGSHTYGPRYTMQALGILLLALMFVSHSREKTNHSLVWQLMAFGAFSFSVAFHHSLMPLSLKPISSPSDFLLSPIATLFPLETPLLPTIDSMMPHGFSDQTPGNYLFRINGQPQNCFLSKIKEDIQENKIVLYQSGKLATFPLMVVNATQKMQVDFLLGYKKLATAIVEPEEISYVQLENPFSKTYYSRLRGEVRWQQIGIQTKILDATIKQATPAWLRLGFVGTMVAEDCSNRLFRLPKLYGQMRFSQPEDSELIDEIDGLYNREPWGRWSQGAQVKLRFKHTLPEKFILVVIAHALGPNIGMPITITAGSAQAAFIAHEQPHSAVLRFTLTEPTDTLVFSVPTPVRPRDLGMGDDERQVGLGLGALQIYEDH